MAKIIMVCYRNEYHEPELVKKIESLTFKLIPENIKPVNTKIIKSKRIIFGIFNPNESCLIKEDRSVYLGSLFEATNWWEPQKDHPDGSYALFRSNEKYVEILSDVVASRTIWYFKDDNIFIASTSQRAIIYFLGSFIFNKKIIPWMLSAGNLGPGQSWDERIKCLNGDSVLTLKRSTWSLFHKENISDFSTLDVSDQEHFNLMKEAIDKTFSSIKIDFSSWVIPLSGGYDSRYILSMLKDKKGISTITWGSKQYRTQKGNDAYIAGLVAEKYGINNSYFELNIYNDEIEKVLNYFIICGEGRIDHLFGYTDSFDLWKILYENKVQGIIRGDVGFSNQIVLSQSDARNKVGFPLCSDYSNLSNYREFGFALQEWPDNLKLEKGMSLETWRDMVYQQIRIPTVLAALSDLKLPYVEIINPFLSRNIIYHGRKLPEYFRARKVLFKKLARLNDTSGVEYARFNTYMDRENILKLKSAVNFLKDELKSYYASSVVPVDFLKYIMDNMIILKEGENVRSLPARKLVKSFTPLWLRNKLKSKILEIKKPVLDFNTLAFRCYLICKINKLFTEDVRRSF